MKERRFAPFFWTQFFGAFNDNLYKNALVILIAYRAASETESGFWVNIASGLFILPFFLFSPLAGQIADKFEKSMLIRIIKFAEIVIMTLGTIALLTGDKVFLISVLFLMGAQSAFFGPIKYSILPQSLKDDELVGGNAMVELGTFVAILTGTIAGGVLISEAPQWAGPAVITFAVLGYLTSRKIPEAPSSIPDLKIKLSFWSEIREMWRLARHERSIHLSILGISWFWFYGAIFLSQIPNFTKYFIGGGESVGTLFLAIFSLSIGIGSLICEKLSHEDIELGLVPFGAFGMSVFALDLYFNSYNPPSTLITFREFFVGGWHNWRVAIDLAMIGLFGSFYTLPLYALIQKRSAPENRSRLIAWLNIVNSLFIVASAGVAIGLYSFGLNTVEIFATVAILNFLVGTYIFFLIPEFLLRFSLWLLAITIYRIRFEGRNRFPNDGPVLIVANHVSFIDWLFITAACRRPARFVMDHRFFFMPLIKWFFKLSKAIPIAPAKESEALKEEAFQKIAAELRDGQVVCVFPEGAITYTGELAPFRPGVERILAENPVPVIPVSIHGLWGSFFSRRSGRAMKGLPKPKWRKILVKINSPMPPTTKASEMEQVIRKMLNESQT